MSADYEPGTVAVATVRGVKGVRVMRVRNLDGWVDENGYAHTPEGHGLDTRTPVTDVRPLVVLDLSMIGKDGCSTIESLVANLRQPPPYCRQTWLADQIEAQTKPPRIPEPGLWGVVRARLVSTPGATVWTAVRLDDGDWRVDDGGTFAWDDLIDPTLIREGLS